MSAKVLRNLMKAVALVTVLCSGRGSAAADSTDDAFPVLFFGTEGPIFLRLQVESGGRTLSLIRDEYVELLFFALDRNHDARLDETEAREIPADGRFGRNPVTVGDEWRVFDTSPTDGMIVETEFRRELEARLGFPLLLLDRPPPLSQSVHLHDRLDTDADRRITHADLLGATETLRAFDLDSDETFSAAELQPFPQSMLAQAMLANSADDTQRAFVLLNAEDRLDRVAERLLKTYGGADAQTIPWKSVELDKRSFAAADRNRNRELDGEELTHLLKDPPVDVHLLVSFSRSEVRVIAHDSAHAALIESDHPRRLGLQLGHERVECDVEFDFGFNDSVGLLMTTRFRSADGDQSGSLNEAEYAGLDGLDVDFAVVDFDADGEILPLELERMALLDVRLVQSSVEMSVQRRDPQPLFQLLDVNGDRRLTAREFHDAAARLGGHDQRDDAGIVESELQEQGSYRLSFSFGMPSILRDAERNRMMMTADRRLPIIDGVSMGPEWYQRMDRNQDGDVTWREFLGPRPTFDELDRDGSGWIDLAEASQER